MDFFVNFTVEDRDWAEWIASHLDAIGHSSVVEPASERDPIHFALAYAAETGRIPIFVLSRAYVRTLDDVAFADSDVPAVVVQVEAIELPAVLGNWPLAAMHLAPNDYARSRDLLMQAISVVAPDISVRLAEPLRPALPAPVGLIDPYPVPEPPNVVELLPAAAALSPLAPLVSVATTAAVAASEFATTVAEDQSDTAQGRSAGLMATDWAARPWESIEPLPESISDDDATETTTTTQDPPFVAHTNGAVEASPPAVEIPLARDHLEALAHVTNVVYPRSTFFWNRNSLLDHLARPAARAKRATEDANPGEGDADGGLDALTLDLRDGRRAVTTTSLAGRRGVGKTALAREVVAELDDAYDIVWWIRAADRTTYLADLAELADRISPGDDEPVSRLRNWLRTTDSRWLLVFDDVPNWDVVSAVLPPEGHGTVLVTAASGVATEGNVAEVLPFSTESSMGFLLQRAGRTENAETAILVEKLGGTAAGLELAAAYVSSMSVSVQDYLGELLDTSSPNRLTLRSPSNALQAAVLAALRAISFYSPQAAHAAVALAACATAGPLPIAVLEGLWEEVENSLCGLLGSFGLILVDGPMIAMVPALRDAIRELAPDGPDAAALLALADALDAAHEQQPDPATNTLLLAHAGQLVDAARQLGCSSPALARLAAHAGEWAAWAGDDDRAAQLRQRAIELSTASNDRTYPETATVDTATEIEPTVETATVETATVETATVEAETGAVEAEVLQDAPTADLPVVPADGSSEASSATAVTDEVASLRANLDAAIAEFGPDSIDALASRNALASAHGAAGHHAAAIQILDDVLQRCRRTFGDEHVDTLTAQANLANGYSDAGDYATAVGMQEQAVADHERVLGSEHPYTLTTRNNLANTYASLGRNDAALVLQERVARDYERTQGAEHPNTLTAKHNLANSYADLSRHQDALELRETVLRQRERVLGVDHPQTLGARNNLANSYADLGRHEEALRLRQAVLAERERVLGVDHPQTLGARNNLANSYADLGNHEEALDLRKTVLSERDRLLGADHPHTLTARNNLANSFAALGRHGEALVLRERALADCERVLGTGHPHTLTARNNLANTYAALGDVTRAQQLRSDVLASRGLSSRAAAAVAGTPNREGKAQHAVPAGLRAASDTPPAGKKKRRFWFFGR